MFGKVIPALGVILILGLILRLTPDAHPVRVWVERPRAAGLLDSPDDWENAVAESVEASRGADRLPPSLTPALPKNARFTSRPYMGAFEPPVLQQAANTEEERRYAMVGPRRVFPDAEWLSAHQPALAGDLVATEAEPARETEGQTEADEPLPEDLVEAESEPFFYREIRQVCQLERPDNPPLPFTLIKDSWREWIDSRRQILRPYALDFDLVASTNTFLQREDEREDTE